MKTPELDKLHQVKKHSQICGEFLEWLEINKGYILCSKGLDRHYYPIYKSKEKLLANFFGINLDKVEKERLALLNELRKKNET